MANDYCETSDVQAGFPDGGLATSTDIGFTGLVASMITRASRLIDREVGRWPGYFYPTTDTRYFDGSGTTKQEIDDCVDITQVSVAEDGGIASTSYTNWTEDTDYFVYPYNWSVNGEPFDVLIINPDGDKSHFHRSHKSVKVVGIFGWSETPPDDIKQAVIIQCVRWYMRSRQGYQDASASPEVGQVFYTKRLDPDIAEILHSYKLRNQV